MNTVLILGGAGGIGYITIQLLKAHTSAKVIATASRPESKRWVESRYGVGYSPLRQLLGFYVTTYGYLALLDLNQRLDVSGLTPFPISVHLENVFTRVAAHQHPEQ